MFTMEGVSLYIGGRRRRRWPGDPRRPLRHRRSGTTSSTRPHTAPKCIVLEGITPVRRNSTYWPDTRLGRADFVVFGAFTPLPFLLRVSSAISFPAPLLRKEQLLQGDSPHRPVPDHLHGSEKEELGGRGGGRSTSTGQTGDLGR